MAGQYQGRNYIPRGPSNVGEERGPMGAKNYGRIFFSLKISTEQFLYGRAMR